MKKKADALMLDELLRAFTHKKFDTTDFTHKKIDIRGFPFGDKKEWSVVPTADKKGVAIKPKGRIASRYEVCVALRDGVLNISLHEDGGDEPLFEITKRVDGNWQVMRPIVGEYVSGKEYIVLTSNKTKEKQK